MAKRTYPGVNGRPLAIDLDKVEAILDEGDGETHLFTSADWYKVRYPFADIVTDWMAL
ncbi:MULTISPECIES: hypothetical protein [unclassified Sphingomonas]|uniref:hypothetical protein n=1 Tax=unclassified Sphingomonas TaxID=196159 RepID=UPI002269B38D|nr:MULTISPECIES: hypothetical protein [unclassified Sphingomonas]